MSHTSEKGSWKQVASTFKQCDSQVSKPLAWHIVHVSELP
jgi:hypothetical protein